MIIVAALMAVAPVDSPEVLPLDEQVAVYEAAMPGLLDIRAETEADVGRLGPTEAGWSMSGVSVAAAISARRGDLEQHVLGEWVVGGHGVLTPGDRPLRVPSSLRRYWVRSHDGPVDFHYYYKLAPGIVIHTFGSVRSIGNASCSRSQGIELISRARWQDWSEETAVPAFEIARATRDDSRTYCTLYRPTDDGGFGQLAYSPDCHPFILTNEDPQVFTVTARAEAAARIFGTDSPAAAE